MQNGQLAVVYIVIVGAPSATSFLHGQPVLFPGGDPALKRVDLLESCLREHAHRRTALPPGIAVGDDGARDELGEFRCAARELGQRDMDRARQLPAFELLRLANIEQDGIAAAEELSR